MLSLTMHAVTGGGASDLFLSARIASIVKANVRTFKESDSVPREQLASKFLVGEDLCFRGRVCQPRNVTVPADHSIELLPDVSDLSQHIYLSILGSFLVKNVLPTKFLQSAHFLKVKRQAEWQKSIHSDKGHYITSERWRWCDIIQLWLSSVPVRYQNLTLSTFL